MRPTPAAHPLLAIAACTLLAASLPAQDHTDENRPGASEPHDIDVRLTDPQARELARTLDHAQTTILHEGSGEPHTLAFTPVQGRSNAYLATLYINLSQTMDGAPLEQVEMPTLSASVDARVTRTTRDRDFVTTSTFTDLGLTDDGAATHDARQTVAAYLESLEGMTAVRTSSARGLPTEPDDVNTTPAADQGLAQRLGQIAFLPLVILPEEPIAPGAIWRARYDFDHAGAEQTLILTYTLRSADDDQISADVHARYLIDEQDLDTDRRAPDIRSRIITGAGALTGEITLDRHTGAPTSGFLRTDTTLTIEAKNPASSVTVDNRMFAELTITHPQADDAQTDD